MAIIINNNPNPYFFRYNGYNCTSVYWNNNLVWPDPYLQCFWVKPDSNDSLVYDYKEHGSVDITKTIEYSFDGINWTTYTSPVSLTAGQTVFIASDNYDEFFWGDGNDKSYKGLSLSNNSLFEVGGDVRALFNFGTMRYLYGFLENSSVTDASKIIFPTTDGGQYIFMFKGCTSLTEAPELPATTLSPYCYTGMFKGCTSLTEAPKLPATTLTNGCYYHMFEGCTSLVNIPELPATTLVSECYLSMFKNCTSLKMSETQTLECPNEYRIPTEGTGTSSYQNALAYMFDGTSGTFTDTPSINTTYYTNATIIS